MIEPNRETVVPASLIEVDAALWDAVRLAWPAELAGVEADESTVFPVARRGDRLVLLARFETFLALQAAGATLVHVWRADADEDEDLVEYAVAFSMPREPG